ncbi:iron-containing alcohol dehydrogenase [Oceanobacillus alkalisoli]|uniref:iron-containing alcohol dehydrogenase n=1 Tax=Oceanobacillus alkalisoli TaxID=2925113 RepID=UPI001F120D27|nr:iron-containing alcohol dehydrogenase [Oceanobacillus alkalisoli]MCF3943525.1 iron-containing alcohol dehydrogenase [Oceanobacillus alkalisoli]
MDNFVFRNPTKLLFGKDQIQALPKEVSRYGKKVLLVYGGGSIKRNGIYDEVMGKLQEMEAEVFELPGVEPNPRLSTVRKGVEICKREGIDFLLAVGGGSTIDCTKAIAAGAKTEADVWDIVMKKEKATDALPLGTILTLAATGSEMNTSSVITNWETKEKHGWGSVFVYPKFSILDPAYTFSVPRDQTVYGIVDIMSHVFEHYFHVTTNAPMQDRFCESILQTMMETAPKLIEHPENYEYREVMMLSSTYALNGMINVGVRGDWATHNLEHAVSAVHDIPHGGGLAILFPNWMKHVLNEGNVARFKQLAVRVFHVETAGKSDEEVALEGIEALRMFWNEIGAPSKLSDYNITADSLELIADKAVAVRPEYGVFKKLNKQDSLEILQASL